MATAILMDFSKIIIIVKAAMFVREDIKDLEKI